MRKNYKIALIVGGVLIILIAVGLFLRSRARSAANQESLLLQEEVIPTVDSSIKVDLKLVRKGEVSLTVDKAPEGTRTIEYEVTYDAQNPGGEEGLIPQGAIGKCSREEGNSWICKSTNQENIILGTCSSGTCIYHEVVGKVKVLLKFSGTYGQRIFEKEYDLEE